MSAADVVDRAEAWDGLARVAPRRVRHTGTDLVGLPPPGRRLLQRAIPPGEVPVASIVLDMEGEMKLKRWLPFTARQILHPTAGFVWNAVVGPWWLRFRGGDSYWRGRGSLQFALAGRVPVVRAAGPDVARSAGGRLVAETVVWAPQALLPAAGARWRPVDDHRAVVIRELDGEAFEVTVTVGDDGVLRDVCLLRWGDPDGELGAYPFGGTVTEVGVFNGITIASAGTAGWWFGTGRQTEGEFFRYRIRNVHLASPGPG